MISFRAHCARGHDRQDYTDPAAFEAHMIGEHKAHRLQPGGEGFGDDPGSEFGSQPAAHGFKGGKFEPYPWKAPRPTRAGLEGVYADLLAGKYDVKPDRYGWGGSKAHGELEQIA